MLEFFPIQLPLNGTRRMKVWLAVHSTLGLLGLLLIVGCGLIGLGESSEKGLRPHDIGSLIEPLEARKLGYNLHWSTDLGVPADQTLSYVEVLGDVVVCVESPSNVVTAISMRDGSTLWRHVVGKIADKLFTPVRSGDLLLINSEQLLYTLKIATGKTVHVTRLESLVGHAPAVVDDVAIFGGLNHRVFAHDIQAGYTKWAYQLTERVFARPAVFGTNTFVADGNGVYAMFSARTGELQWKGRTFARISARPTISHLGVYIAGEDHSLYALHTGTGRDRWIYHTTQPLTQSPIIFSNIVFLPISGQGLVVLDARTGVEKWRLPFDATPIDQFEDALLVHTKQSLVSLQISTGKVLSEVPVLPLKKVIPLPDRQLVLVSRGGRMLLLDPETKL